MLKYFRNTIAFCLSVVLFCACISVPITGNAATPQARSLRFLVLYDESYMTSLDDTTGRDTSSRLGEAFWYASLPFYEKWNISIDFDFYKYDDVIGVPYSASIQYPDSCLGMWSWTTQNNQNVRSWIVNGACECDISNCFNHADPSIPGHHSSGSRILYDTGRFLLDARTPYDAVITVVGHSICSVYNNSHGMRGGLTNIGYHTVLIPAALSYGWEQIEYHPTNFNHIITVFQHEVSHLFCAYDNGCIRNNQPCIMGGGFDNVRYARDIWCPTCANQFSPGYLD